MAESGATNNMANALQQDAAAIERASCLTKGAQCDGQLPTLLQRVAELLRQHGRFRPDEPGPRETASIA